MDSLNDIEIRLEKAMLYKKLCSADLKLGNSDAAAEINKEIQEFAMEKLQFLLGMKNPVPLPISVRDNSGLSVDKPSRIVQLKQEQSSEIAIAKEESAKVEEQVPAEVFVVNPDSPEPITYTKTGMVHPKTNEPIWVGPNNGKFVMATNQIGGKYMRSISMPTMPIGVTPLQRLGEDAMAITAARHLAAAKKANPLAASLTEE